ncbi:MAG: response regulator [Phycisphaerales bacterium]
MKRVIFVDDEPNVLRALRRVLRGVAAEWSVTFVASGQEALTLLEREPYDALVTDFMMPGMDGGQLLRRAFALQPGLVRIMLTGNAPPEQMARIEGLVHRMLAKPCSPERIHGSVELACDALDRLADPHLRAMVAGTASLVADTSELERLQTAVGAEPASIADAAMALERDPSLASKALKLVHAGFFGGEGPADAGRPVPAPTAAFGAESHSLRPGDSAIRVPGVAAGLLGQQTLAAMSDAPHFVDGGSPEMNEAFDVAQEASRARARRHWAERVAGERGLPESRVKAVGLAAMLLNVGGLLLARAQPDLWRRRTTAVLQARAAAEPDEQWQAQIEAERRVLGASVPEIGAALLGSWGLPSAVVAGVRDAATESPGSLSEIVARASQAIDAEAAGVGEAEAGPDAAQSRSA